MDYTSALIVYLTPVKCADLGRLQKPLHRRAVPTLVVGRCGNVANFARVSRSSIAARTYA